MKKIKLFLLSTFMLSTIHAAYANDIQQQQYQFPPNINELHCQLTLKFSDHIVLGPVPVTYSKNQATTIDNDAVRAICKNTICKWMKAEINRCDNNLKLINADPSAKATLTYDVDKQQYTASPNLVVYTFEIK